MITANELLELAKRLRAGGSEVELRAAASRGYYALFHFAKTFHTQLPEPGRAAPSGAGGDHVDLAHRLKRPARSVEERDPDLASKSKRIGVLLDSARPTRHHADYDLGKPFDVGLADQLIQTTERTFQL